MDAIFSAIAWIFGFISETIIVALAVAFCATPIAIVFAILRKIWKMLGNGPTKIIITFGDRTSRVLDWMRRSSSYRIAYVVTAILIVPPHVIMSWHLREYKTEFKQRVAGSHYVIFPSDSPGVYEYGGKLDEVVEARVRILAQHQFVPDFTAYWHTMAIGSTTVGAYVYTFMPKSLYDSIMINGIFNGNSKEYYKFLDKPSTVLPRDRPFIEVSKQHDTELAKPVPTTNEEKAQSVKKKTVIKKKPTIRKRSTKPRQR
jgi:hypothetical protein